MGKQYEELGITDAFMFAKVMSNKEICKPVLEQILSMAGQTADKTVKRQRAAAQNVRQPVRVK